MIERTADANWKGGLKDGHGLTSTESKTLTEQQFSFSTRFEQNNKGTNPEELIASAAASCFAMALAKEVGEQGHDPVEVHVRANLGLDMNPEPKVKSLRLTVEGLVPGISKDDFVKAAQKTKEGCPVLRLLTPGLDNVEMDAALQE